MAGHVYRDIEKAGVRDFSHRRLEKMYMGREELPGEN